MIVFDIVRLWDYILSKLVVLLIRVNITKGRPQSFKAYSEDYLLKFRNFLDYERGITSFKAYSEDYLLKLWRWFEVESERFKAYSEDYLLK